MSGDHFKASASASHSPLNDSLKRPARLVSKTEIERLEAMRQKALPQRRLRPDNVDHAQLDDTLLKSHEWRLKDLKDRLEWSQSLFHESQFRAFNKNRAKDTFDRKAGTPVNAATKKLKKAGLGWER